MLLACGGGASGDGGSNGGGQTPVGPGPGAYGFEIYVSPAGSDTNPGTADKPLATLEQARAMVRAELAKGLPSKGIAVWLRAGVYVRTTTLDLTTQDSGTESIPVVWSGYPGETVRVVGSRALDATWFTPVTSASSVWNRLDASAKGTVLEVDLPAHGISDYGTLLPRGYGFNNKAALELSINGKVQPLARWPDADQNTPRPTVQDSSVRIFGNLTPDVTGNYRKVSTQDGVSAFEREGLVAGKQYRLYRLTWSFQGIQHIAWFLTTSAMGSYPNGTDPWWYLYKLNFGSMAPTNGASGNAAFVEPTAFNHGFASVAGKGTSTTFTMASDRLNRWTTAPDAWIHGYLAFDWADDHLPIASINAPAKQITLGLVPPLTSDTGGIQSDQAWYAENLLEELTQPGEWYLDRATGRLYLWPTANFSSAEIRVSMFDGPLFNFNSATGVRLQNMSLESTRTGLVDITRGAGIELRQLWLRNAGKAAVFINGGFRHRVRQCHLIDSGETGIYVTGGDRPTLTRSDHGIEDCEFEGFGRFAYTYSPGIRLSGVGITVRHNLFHDATHSALIFGGNDHLIELNEIRNVCTATGDAGAIYAWRDWGARGNVIRHNFIHHVNSIFWGLGVHGIYLDNAISGIEMSGNILYGVSGHAIQHGGGRDNLMMNNLMVRCGDALAPSTGAYTSWKAGNPDWVQGGVLTDLLALHYKLEPWASRYPNCAAIPNDWAVVTANNGNPWLYPQGCVFSRNFGYANDRWILDTAPMTWYREQKDNVANQDPLFVDESHLDLTLRSDSPALAIPGFQPIPFRSIGLRSEALPPR
ncbi:MAG: right-handed parallel beta-helix repeat-containing protein [Firmicutes bacterium]|nr:right-handed parallel beta-helix repeat-containing protein [Bacillota bacterium]